MTNYDSHLFIEELITQKNCNVNIKVIPQIEKGLLSLTYGRLGIIDSMSFMKMCLDRKIKVLDLDDFLQTKKNIWR